MSSGSGSDQSNPFNPSGAISRYAHYELLTIDFIFPGAHTIGKAHCVSFANRLSPLDPRMSKNLVKNLLQVCPTVESSNKTALDRKSPEKFDRKYYKNLMKKMTAF